MANPLTLTGPVQIKRSFTPGVVPPPTKDGELTGNFADKLLFGRDQSGNVFSFSMTGPAGAAGKSAYELALAAGFSGSQAQWIASLKGANGANGTAGINGSNGSNGASAYEIAVANGFTGTQAQWVASLSGSAAANAFSSAPIAVTATTTIAVGDTGKFYSMALATKPTVTLPDPASLPSGWSIDLEVTGTPSSYQTAFVTHTNQSAGTAKFLHMSLATDKFFLIGNGEVFRIVRDSAGKFRCMCLQQPAPFKVERGYTGAGAWNSGLAAWGDIPFNVWWSGAISAAFNPISGGFQVPVSGVWGLKSRSQRYASDGVMHHFWQSILVNGAAHDYEYECLPGYGSKYIIARHDLPLPAGASVQGQKYDDNSYLYYYPDNSLFTATLLSR